MPIRRTRMIGGERYIVSHRGTNEEIKEIMGDLKFELEKNKIKREELKKAIKYVKTIREKKNKLLKEATEVYKNKNNK